MAQEFTTTGSLRRGKLKLRNARLFTDAMGAWKDGEVIVTITRAHAHRSSQANRYYWGVIVRLLSEHTGYTPEETHACLKQLFLPKRCAMLDGNGEVLDDLVIGGSTTKLNTIEFGEYCTRIREWAFTKLSVDIPLPESSSEAA